MKCPNKKAFIFFNSSVSPSNKPKKVIPVVPPKKPNTSDIVIKHWDMQKRPVPKIPSDNNVDKNSTKDKDSSDSNSFSDVDSNASYDEVINLNKNSKDKLSRFNVTPVLPPPPPVATEEAVNPEDEAEYDEVLNLPLPVELIRQKDTVKPTDSLENKPKLKPKPTLKLFK